jgi:hypothetical protein
MDGSFYCKNTPFSTEFEVDVISTFRSQELL